MSKNYYITKAALGYEELKDTPQQIYSDMGLKCGLEVHQQLHTEKKLFCSCPAGIYQKPDQYDAEIIRHMRPTLSEMGGYDGTALMEFKTKKNITYRISNETTCTYDIDDTPPFKINRQALDIALEVAHLLKSSIVGELHITRKQYLDGSIPAGFQRTGIISIEGEIPLSKKKVGIIQMSIEEDSCREVQDIGHERIYTTDRLGMPLIETVTYPHMTTPSEAAEAANYIRFLNRSTGKVRIGIGAAREDVNVSISGGSRVEIKGVSHIKWIPSLVHNEAFRQKSLLYIKDELNKLCPDINEWRMKYLHLRGKLLDSVLKTEPVEGYEYYGVNLPLFKNLISCFTQPGKMFGDEIAQRLKVIACMENPNMIHSEDWYTKRDRVDFIKLKNLLCGKDYDAQLLIFGPADDIKTALETIEERCLLAFECVPNETRKSFPDGTTIFERVLPGADRMYPDTDSAPIPITEDMIRKSGESLPVDVRIQIDKLRDWNVPVDTYTYLLRNNLIPMIEFLCSEYGYSPKFMCTTFAHRVKNFCRKHSIEMTIDDHNILNLFDEIHKRKFTDDMVMPLLGHRILDGSADLDTLLSRCDYKNFTHEEISSRARKLQLQLEESYPQKDASKIAGMVMKKIRPDALGNITFSELFQTLLTGGMYNER